MDKEYQTFIEYFAKELVIVLDDYILIGVGCHVYNFDRYSGEIIWDFKTEHPVISMLLIPDKKGVIINDELYVIRINTDGKKVWERSCYEDVIIDIQISGNKVDVKEFGDRATYSINIDTGEVFNLKINKDHTYDIFID